MAPHPLGGLLIVHEEVTDRMRLERSYNTLIAVQRETLENLRESVAVFGADSRLKLHNSQFREMWCHDESDLESEPHVTDILASINEAYGRPSEWAEQFPRTAALIAERHALHVSVDRPDGSVVDFATQPLPDGNLLATYIDVTDRVRIERALRERNEALQTADHLKTEFTAATSASADKGPRPGIDISSRHCQSSRASRSRRRFSAFSRQFRASSAESSSPNTVTNRSPDRSDSASKATRKPARPRATPFENTQPCSRSRPRSRLI